MNQEISMNIAPWLFVRGSREAVAFYQAAFNAKEIYRHEGKDGVVSQLAIGHSYFWLSEESPEHGNLSPETLKGTTLRLLITVADPDVAYQRACDAGAQPLSPVSEGHGWKVGKVADSFGYTWEIGRPVK
jgi:PhnB protein